jgi:hypothetical protein
LQGQRTMTTAGSLVSTSSTVSVSSEDSAGCQVEPLLVREQVSDSPLILRICMIRFRLGLAVHSSGKRPQNELGATVTTPPATSGPPAPDPSVVNPVQPSGPPKKRPTGLIVLLIILAVLLMGVIGWVGLINGEYLCLDRRPWWGPPENPEVYTSCSGHIDELLRKWGWASWTRPVL